MAQYAKITEVFITMLQLFMSLMAAFAVSANAQTWLVGTITSLAVNPHIVDYPENQF
ncbi:MAG: hypothetical protein ACKVQK_13505 [Burkholderiales bacterium]